MTELKPCPFCGGEAEMLGEALESIKKMSSYLSVGEITIYYLLDIHNICCDALKGGLK